MPANLPPQYFEAERRLRSTESPLEKIEILRTMLAIMPHHKGTDKLQAELRSKIAKLNKEAQKKHVIRRYSYHIEKEGVAQVVLLGLPNSGKSRLLDALTNANPEIAEYPFTTKQPIIGMMAYKNIQIQLIDTPAINHSFMDKWLSNIAREADLILLIVNLSTNPTDELTLLKEKLEQRMIKLTAENMLTQEIGYACKKTIIVANKLDLNPAEENLKKLLSRRLMSLRLKNKWGRDILIVPVSAEKGTGLSDLRTSIYNSLDIIRVYTKVPSEEPDLNDPIILRKGSTVIKAARDIHKDFVGNLKYVRLWGSNKFDGQRVERNHVLEDGDVIEFHI